MVSPCVASSKRTEGKLRFVGPPWAPRESPSPNEIAKRTPMDDYLDKMGGASDSRNDFAAATYAMMMASKARK